MSMTLSSAEFNQSVSKAQKEALHSPVFITKRGQLSHVLLSYDDYQKLTGKKAKSALALLTPPPELAAKMADIELDIPPRSKAQRRPVDFGED